MIRVLKGLLLASSLVLAAPAFATVLEGVALAAPRVPVWSNRTARLLDPRPAVQRRGSARLGRARRGRDPVADRRYMNGRGSVSAR